MGKVAGPLAIGAAALLAGCAVPAGAPPAPVVPTSFNTEPWVGTQSPGSNYVSVGPEQPFQTPNSLPSGAETEPYC